ncbi:MAG TPA: outer membrane protein assembly factor BamA [Chthoniobacterales bacterium]|nr:outer membrane protein assembly factor BamA [Chthoniobacterales bacterium]
MRQFPGSLRRPSSIFLAFVCALLGAAVARGQGPPVVRSIDVRYTGPATVSKERILAQMRTAVGQLYSDQVVEQDIQNLYKTGAILNVRIFAQPEGDGVKVIVAVQTRSAVREIEIAGAQQIKARRIRKEIGIKINSMVNEEELEKSRQKIIDIYKARGFNDVDVQYRVEPIDEKRGTSRVIYTINEGVRGAIRAIRFEGNAHFSDKVLRKQMKTRGKTLISFLDKSGRLDETQLQQDLDSVKEFYQNHGYIDVEVKGVRKERENGPMIITIAITEGTQYHVGKISISGYAATTEQKIRALLKMKEGAVYSPKALHDDAKAVADAYGSGGYVDTLIVPEGAPAGPGRIDVHYKIEEGDRFFVQRINIVGNTRTKDKVIRREVLVAPGDVFNTVRVDVSKKRLENLGYFSKVETYPDDTGVAGRKDLTVQVEEKRTGSFTFGGGYSTVDSLVGFAELTQGNFDLRNWPAFTGAGQKFRLRVQYGTQRKDVILILTEPWFLDRPFSVSGQLFYSEANYLSSLYDQRDYGFVLEARKPLSSYIYATLGYRLESLEIFNVASDISPALAQELGTQTKSQIYTSFVFDRRDNPLLTRTGQRVTISPYIAGGFLGGNDQIYGWSAEGSQYFHMWWDTILLLNGEIATVSNWGGGSDVRIFDRLFLGGSNNLRGFDYRDVSPKDENKEPLGGKSMARTTVEWTFPIIEKARGAIFYDIGFVNPDAWDFSEQTQFIPAKPRPVGSTKPPRVPISYDNIASDFGVGLRLDLPIGPLRLDYGIPVQKAGTTGSGKFNFSVGYQF